MARTYPVQPYGPLEEIAPHLYVMEGEWFGSPFKRRMTIVQLKSGDLVIHSAIRLNPEDYDRIDQLGPVKFIVVPNSHHASEAHFYAERYPEAKVMAAFELQKKLRKQTRVDGILSVEWPPEVKNELDCIELRGTRFLNECVFFHVRSRTLITTDLVFNMGSQLTGLTKFFFKWNQIYDRFGPSRIFQSVILKSKAQLRSSLENVFKWDFDRIIMSHGKILESGGKKAMVESFTFLSVKRRWKIYVVTAAAFLFGLYQLDRAHSVHSQMRKMEKQLLTKDEEIQKLNEWLSVKSLENDRLSSQLAEKDRENKAALAEMQEKLKKPTAAHKKKKKKSKH